MCIRDRSTALLLVTPSLPLNRPAGGEQLTPLLLATAGGPGSGLLVSAATRRPGLVQNTDLVSMVLSLLAGTEKNASPRPVSSFGIIPDKEPLDFLDRFSTQAALVFNQRSPLLKGYVAALVAALLAEMCIRDSFRGAGRQMKLLSARWPASLLKKG